MSVICINFSVAPLIVPEIPSTAIETRIPLTLVMHASAALASRVFSRAHRRIPYLPSKDMSAGAISQHPVSPNNECTEFKISLINSCRLIVRSDITSKAVYRFLSRRVGRVFILFQRPPVRIAGIFFSES